MRRRREYFTVNPGDPEPLVAEVRHKLMFSEVDALAIAWHGHYPRFFELAHSALMERVGLTWKRYYECRLGAPMVQCHVDYYRPLMLGDEFTVSARLYWTEAARLDVGYSVTGADGELRGTGYTVQMFFDYFTHEPLFVTPPILEEMRARWRSGAFHA